MKPIKGKVMTNAEEVRELRNWLREEAKTNRGMVRDLHKKIDDGNRELHKKIDDCNKENQKEHKEISKMMADVNTDGKVNSSKIMGVSALVATMVSGLVIIAFRVMAGG